MKRDGWTTLILALICGLVLAGMIALVATGSSSTTLWQIIVS